MKKIDIKGFVCSLREKGFFSIFTSNVLNKVITFLGGMIIVRVMSKSDYGTYAYIINCFGMLSVINDLGCSQATRQFCAEKYGSLNEFESFFVYGVKTGMKFILLTVIVIILSPLFYPYNDIKAARLTQSLCLVPFITTLNAFMVSNLRCRFETKKYSLVNTISCIINYTIILPLAFFYGVNGAIISKYLIAIIEVAFTFFISGNSIKYNWKNDKVNKSDKKDFIKLAFSSQLSSSINRVMVLLDVFFIGLIVKDMETISLYKIGSVIPAALDFIPESVMVVAIPYFANHNKDINWIKRNYRKIIGVGIFGYAGIALICFILAPIMISLAFGRQYLDSLLCFRILLVGFFFSAAFRIPINNIIYTQRKVFVNVFVSLFGGLLNCGLDYFLIMKLGSIGAAISTSSIQIIISIIEIFYMEHIIKKAEETRV